MSDCTIALHPNRERPRWLRALTARLPGATVLGLGDDLSAARYAMAWRPPPDLFARAPRLEVFFALGAGVDHLTALVPPHVTLVRLEDAGMVAQMVAYHRYAVLHYYRDFDRFAAQQRSQVWAPRAPRVPSSLRVRVLGAGVLGRAVADALQQDGFDVACWARRPRRGGGDRTRHGEGGLAATLSEADVLIVLLPLTPQTAGLLDASRLSLLPAGAAVINAARGGLLDAAALCAALDGGLRGAFLDVAPEEPLPATHPLWSHPGVVLTPHIAAMTLPEPSVAQVVANLQRHRRGQPMSGVVDRAAGY